MLTHWVGWIIVSGAVLVTIGLLIYFWAQRAPKNDGLVERWLGCGEWVCASGIPEAVEPAPKAVKGETMKVHKVEIRCVERTVKGKKRVEWSWHAKARNGRKLGWTGETHTKRQHCIEALEAVVDPWERGIPVYEMDGDKGYLIRAVE